MRLGAAVGLALAGGLAACGTTSDAGVTGDAAAEASSSRLALPPGSPRTPGEDRTCNDDPAMSALAGRCESNGECLCDAAFSYDWNTGRCRSGTACSASAGDPWPDKVPALTRRRREA